MQRRDILKFVSASVGGAALLTGGQALAGRPRSRTSAARRNGPYVETADGAQLFFRDWGEGPALLFLSGWTLPSDIWAYQMTPLSEAGFRCVAYDRRGHGRSSDPGRGYDYDTLANDLGAVLEALDLREVTVVAHSMAGGEVVRRLSLGGPRRIARVALVGTTLPFLMKTEDNPDGVDPAIFEQTRQSVLTKDFPTLLQANLQPFVMPETSDAMLEWVRNLMLQCSLKAAIDCNKALTTTDFRAELRALATPALFVHGDRDVSAPAPLTLRKAAQLAPHAAIKLYEGAPHGLMLTHAAQLSRDLTEFARS
jgi:pimeloyl-ACP methyl ester carboxylesterase